MMGCSCTEGWIDESRCLPPHFRDPSGQELGVARQREDCEKLCADKGWTPVEYVDNDTSATNGKPGPPISGCSPTSATAIGAIVAWDLDRLHRRPIELESFMAWPTRSASRWRRCPVTSTCPPRRAASSPG